MLLKSSKEYTHTVGRMIVFRWKWCCHEGDDGHHLTRHLHGVPVSLCTANSDPRCVMSANERKEEAVASFFPSPFLVVLSSFFLSFFFYSLAQGWSDSPVPVSFSFYFWMQMHEWPSQSPVFLHRKGTVSLSLALGLLTCIQNELKIYIHVSWNLVIFIVLPKDTFFQPSFLCVSSYSTLLSINTRRMSIWLFLSPRLFTSYLQRASIRCTQKDERKDPSLGRSLFSRFSNASNV